MANEEVKADNERDRSRYNFVRRWLIRLAVIAFVFLLGFGPMWLVNWRTSQQLDASRENAGRRLLENELATAAIYSRRGNYEIGRQSASSFFTGLQSELAKSDSSFFTESEKTQLAGILTGRDDVITLLSRNDPASADRLSDLYVTYRSAMVGYRVSD